MGVLWRNLSALILNIKQWWNLPLIRMNQGHVIWNFPCKSRTEWQFCCRGQFELLMIVFVVIPEVGAENDGILWFNVNRFSRGEVSTTCDITNEDEPSTCYWNGTPPSRSFVHWSFWIATSCMNNSTWYSASFDVHWDVEGRKYSPVYIHLSPSMWKEGKSSREKIANAVSVRKRAQASACTGPYSSRNQVLS